MVSKFDLLFEQWKASLADRDKRTPSIQGNFEELFESFKTEGLVLESAYEYLEKAIKAHSPTPSLVKTMYKKFKVAGTLGHDSEKDLQEAWIKNIAEKANIAFFNVFPIVSKKSEEEKEPKIYGGMTAKEYKMQRQYADEFPILNTEELEKRLNEPYDPTKEIKVFMGKTSGDDQ